MKAESTTKTINETFQVEPVLRKVLIEAEQEHSEIQDMFNLMGWGDLPDALKIEIRNDVAAMAEELKGNYSTCDEFVLRRRRSVSYWIECFKNGSCTLQTAIKALRVKKL